MTTIQEMSSVPHPVEENQPDEIVSEKDSALGVEDLWPDGFTVSVRSPVAILKQQAAVLSRKTEGIVRGRVTTAEDLGEVTFDEFTQESPPEASKVNSFSSSLLLEVPGLGGYRANLLTIHFAIHTPYPVTYSDIYNNHGECADERSFLEMLRALFSNERTRQLIANLLSHATA